MERGERNSAPLFFCLEKRRSPSSAVRRPENGRRKTADALTVVKPNEQVMENRSDFLLATAETSGTCFAIAAFLWE
jgi:hypothetical protein